jgi:decaprenyl-phosphate phosphoribosyltransferase
MMTGVAPDDDVRPSEPSPRSLPVAIFVAARPKQWLKNVLVFVAPGAAGVLSDGTELVATFVAFVAFCLASSGTYLLNDASDVESDRLHDTKRFRPIAAGDLPITGARLLGAGFVVAGLLLALLGDSIELALVILGYVALTTCYSLWLKHIAVIDMAAIAAGFMLRAVAGAVAADVPISDWFFIVASAASVFVVAGKRHAERLELGDRAGEIRPTLAAYTDSYLAYVRSVASGVALLAYCLWAFDQASLVPDGDVAYEVSILPFVLGVLRYAMLLDAGEGGAPEDVVLRDRPLQVIGVVWVIVFGLAVYGV